MRRSSVTPRYFGRGSRSVRSQATPPEVLAKPGLLDKVIALGANAPQYPIPGPTRTELLATIAAAHFATIG